MMEQDVPSFGVGTQTPRQGYNRDRWIETPINMGYGQLTNSNATLYTAPSGTIAGAASQKALLLEIWLCNTDTTARTVTIYVVESGGSAADNRAIYKDFSIAAKTSVRQECWMVLESNSTIQGLADTTLKVTYRFSGKSLT
jgi:hypothetical protein